MREKRNPARMCPWLTATMLYRPKLMINNETSSSSNGHAQVDKSFSLALYFLSVSLLLSLLRRKFKEPTLAHSSLTQPSLPVSHTHTNFESSTFNNA